MFRWISDTAKAIWFFLKFATVIILGYLVMMGVLWLLRQPMVIEFKRSSIGVWDFLERFETAVTVSGWLFLLTFGLHFLDRYLFRQRLLKFGRIFSKGFFPLVKMFTFPFFHGNFSHLRGTASLTVLFAGLAVMIIPSLTLVLQVAIIMFLVQGFGVWIFGRRGTPHVGSSGLMLGLFSFDVLFGILELGWQTAVALLLLYFFGRGMFRTLTDRSPNTSVEAHFWGFASGLVIAYFVSPFGPLSIY